MNILVADDQKSYSNAIAMILNPYAKFIAEAYNTQELFVLIEQVKFDILLLDYSFPHLNGIETVKNIKMVAPELKILSVSMFKDKNIIQKLLDAGVRGYFCKDSELDKLIIGISAIMLGNIYLDDQVINILHGESTKANGLLVERELDILKLKMEGFSGKEIADKLCLTTSTIDYHCKNMIEKTNCRNINQLIRLATLNCWI
ncbi:MAG: DNA-binding response regulator [Bacteroidetes bacterium]|nr:MAG: DNA-binding response regulator [Bacteroidota bacterium]